MTAADRRLKAATWHKQVENLLCAAMPQERTGSTELDGDLPLEPGVPVFRVATRVGTLPNVRRALREVQENVPQDRLPLAIIRDERYAQEFAAMPLDSFLLLISGWWAATQPCSEAAQPKQVLAKTRRGLVHLPLKSVSSEAADEIEGQVRKIEG